MDAIWQDIRYGMRTLWRAPGFTLVAVLTLALGIGANTAIFSVVHAVLLAPLPYQDGDQLVIGYRRAPTMLRTGASYPDFTDMQESGAFASVVAIRGRGLFLEGEEGPRLVGGADVSPGFFELLGVVPAQGRTFLTEEEQTREKVAVVSHELWDRHFARDADIVGKPIRLSGTMYTVVGVLPPGYRDPVRPVSGVEVYMPLVVPDSQVAARNSQWLQLLARIPRGRTLAQARAVFEPLSARAYEEKKGSDVRSLPSFTVIPLREYQVGNAQQVLWLILGAVALVLLIGCANVANLLLARLTSRHGELAVRAAVGASRTRLAMQLMTESFLLSLLGGLAALVFLLWGLDAVRVVSPVEIPWMERTRLDLPVFAFAFAATLVCGLLFGALPALRSARLDFLTALKLGPVGSAKQRRALNLLLAGEVALTVTLLVGATLAMTSLVRLHGVDPGFDSSDVLTVDMTSADDWSPARRALFAEQLQERARAIPGVRAVGSVETLPLSGNWSQYTTTAESFLEQVPPDMQGKKIEYEHGVVGGDYFRAMSIPLLSGRLFTGTDGPAGDSGVVIVSQDLAHSIWGDADPVGQRVKFYNPWTRKLSWSTIVGVVGPIRYRGLDVQPNPTLYRPLSQAPTRGNLTVVLRGSNPEQFAPSVRQIALDLDRTVVLLGSRTYDEILRERTAVPRFLAMLLGGFASVAVLLAAVGIYGVLSYAVSQRRGEIGIRLALGAQPGTVLWMTVRAGMTWAVAGLAVGLAAAFWLARLMRALLFEVSPSDPAVYAGIAVFLAAVALLACWLPARRAARVDPMVALRYE